MSKKRRINHLVRALKQAGFYDKETLEPGVFNVEVRNDFLWESPATVTL